MIGHRGRVDPGAKYGALKIPVWLAFGRKCEHLKLLAVRPRGAECPAGQGKGGAEIRYQDR